MFGSYLKASLNVACTGTLIGLGPWTDDFKKFLTKPNFKFLNFIFLSEIRKMLREYGLYLGAGGTIKGLQCCVKYVRQNSICSPKEAPHL